MDRAARIHADGLSEDPVEFYRPWDTYGEFSNFDEEHPMVMLHPFRREMVEHRSGEHRFQAMKATCEKDYDLIVAARKPLDAKHAGRAVKLRPGWGEGYGDLCWFVMTETLIAKTVQHRDVCELLLSTGARAIWESSPIDSLWGIRSGDDRSGKNLLGRSWMYVRSIAVALG